MRSGVECGGVRDVAEQSEPETSTIVGRDLLRFFGNRDPNPRESQIRAKVSADLAPNIRRHHSRGDRIQSKWRDPNPRGIQIRA